MILDPGAGAVTHTHNELYGSAEVYRRYLGIADRRLRIAGQLQHGWSAGISIADLTALGRLYLWSDRGVAQVADPSRTTTIGAPFLYLPPHNDIPRSVPRSVIAFPEHSTPGHPFVDQIGTFVRYAEFLEEVRRDGDLDHLTVCLQVNDYEDAAVTRIFRRRGIICTSAGAAFGDPTFLTNLRGLILAHDYATSNVVSTPLFYAGYLRKPVFVAGPIGERIKDSTLAEERRLEPSNPVWIRRNFPEFTRYLDSEPAYDVSCAELGLQYKRSVVDLWSALDFVVQA